MLTEHSTPANDSTELQTNSTQVGRLAADSSATAPITGRAQRVAHRATTLMRVTNAQHKKRVDTYTMQNRAVARPFLIICSATLKTHYSCRWSRHLDRWSSRPNDTAKRVVNTPAAAIQSRCRVRRTEKAGQRLTVPFSTKSHATPRPMDSERMLHCLAFYKSRQQHECSACGAPCDTPLRPHCRHVLNTPPAARSLSRGDC